jgi:hypothetical protein
MRQHQRALVLQGLTGGLLGPAIAAISLGLVGHSALAERLGRNQRFASAGALTTTGVMALSAIFCLIKRYSSPLLHSRFHCLSLYPASGRLKSTSVALADNPITTR